MAGGEIRLIPFSENTRCGNRSRQYCRLRDLRQPELLFRPFEAKLRELVSQRFVGVSKSLPRDGIFLRQIFAHADSLRALSGKQKCDGTLVVDTVVAIKSRFDYSHEGGKPPVLANAGASRSAMPRRSLHSLGNRAQCSLLLSWPSTDALSRFRLNQCR